jgi:hypothetical protein
MAPDTPAGQVALVTSAGRHRRVERRHRLAPRLESVPGTSG